MKIGIITYSLNIGGVSTFILSLSQYFIKKGHSVEIITEDKKGPWFSEINKKNITSHAINCGIFGWIPFGTFFHAYRVGKFIKKRRFDVVLLNHCLYAQLAAHLYNKHAIVIPVVHNNNFGVYQVATRNPANINAIACVSLATLKGIKKYTDFKNIICIPNGIELPKIKPIFPKSNNNILNIIFVGHLIHEQKGIFFIPDILKRCKEINPSLHIHLTIVGEGNDKDELIRRLAENKIEHLVSFEGNISREKVYELYLNHHIFLMPSFYEGLPLTLIESMACGCVPIVSFLKDITDYCINDTIEGFLCPIGDINTFVDNITYLGTHPSIMTKMGACSYEKAETFFSIKRMGDDYLTLIKNKSYANSTHRGFSFSIYSWKDMFPREIVLFYKKQLSNMRSRLRNTIS